METIKERKKHHESKESYFDKWQNEFMEIYHDFRIELNKIINKKKENNHNEK